jgi:hypothetical protein
MNLVDHVESACSGSNVVAVFSESTESHRSQHQAWRVITCGVQLTLYLLHGFKSPTGCEEFCIVQFDGLYAPLKS